MTKEFVSRLKFAGLSSERTSTILAVILGSMKTESVKFVGNPRRTGKSKIYMRTLIWEGKKYKAAYTLSTTYKNPILSTGSDYKE